MGQTMSNLADRMGRLKAQLLGERKKAAVLGVLTAAMVVVLCRLAVTRSTAPASASAAPVAGTKGPDGPADGPGVGEAQSGAARGAHLARLDRNITRDLFKPDPELFPLVPGGAAAVVKKAPPPLSLLARMRGWLARRAETERQRKRREAAIRARAGALLLESVMLGEHPAVLINEKILCVGDSIRGFRITRITAGGCVVRRQGVNVELKMKGTVPPAPSGGAAPPGGPGR